MLDASWSWVAILALGALHGLNPGMGWLLAVALGFQEGKEKAVWRALPPLAVGHAVAVGVVVAVALLFGEVLPADLLRWVVAAALVAYGVRRLERSRHPRYGGMRVGARELTTWSFLMAWAHGAGLMVVPLVLRSEGAGHGPAHRGIVHAGHVASDQMVGLLATAVHTAAYLAVAGAIAWVVYRKVGVRFLRRAWLNLDLVWGAVLILTGIATLVI
jgi:hypothetical protein